MSEDDNVTFRMLFLAADKYPPFRVDVSKLFAEEIAQRGHKIDWILQSENDCSSSYVKQWGGGTAFIGRTKNGESRLSRTKKHLLEFLHNLALFPIMREQQYDFLQVRDKYVIAALAIIAARMFNVKLILWLSFPFPEAGIHYARDGSARYPLFYYLRGTIQKALLYKLLAPSAKHIFLQSLEMKRMFLDQGINESKLTVVPMGFSASEINSNIGDVSSQTIKQSPLSVVYAGSLARLRKIDFVLRTFRLVLDQIPDAILYLIGAGDDAFDDEIIASECANLELEQNVELTGFLPQREAFQYVKLAAVCISPIYPDPILSAGSPTKLVEYMAFGKAVVANDQIEQRQILEESGGGICVPWEEQAYADAIVELLLNPEKAARMGEAGQRYIEKHRNYRNIASEVEKVYLRLCQN